MGIGASLEGMRVFPIGCFRRGGLVKCIVKNETLTRRDRGTRS